MFQRTLPALACLLPLVACGAGANIDAPERTESSSAALSLSGVCGAAVTVGGCVTKIDLGGGPHDPGTFPGDITGLHGYFDAGKTTITLDGVPVVNLWFPNLTTPSGPTDFASFRLPALPAGAHTMQVTIDGVSAANLTFAPLTVTYSPLYIIHHPAGENDLFLPMGGGLTLSVAGGGLYDGLNANVGSVTVPLSGCNIENTECSFKFPAVHTPGEYDVYVNNCPATGNCRVPNSGFPVFYTAPCYQRYRVEPDGSVLDETTKIQLRYTGHQDAEQYCNGFYGCGAPASVTLRRFFGNVNGGVCTGTPALSSFPKGKYWTNESEREDDDSVSATSYDDTNGSLNTEDAMTSYYCACAE